MNMECDANVFANGKTICAVDGRSGPVEEWVQRVAKESGQAVDWHYSGGVANVLCVGDHARAIAAVMSVHRSNEVRIMRMYGPDDRGLYRAGDHVPDGAVAVDVAGGVVGLYDEATR